MRNVSIFTWCDNNGPTNYGQILQCYAMQELCKKQGLQPQVVYFREKKQEDFVRGTLPFRVLNRWYEFWFKIWKVEGKLDKRILRFCKFIRRNIQLSTPCYTIEQVKKASADSKFLLCGSDQIWNPLWFHPVYALNFGSREQRKIAYAPSGVAVEDDFCKEKYRELAGHLEDFYRISVREKHGAEILQSYTEKKIEDVLDPTFLLDSKEWDKVVAKRLVKEPYVFCYTLGGLRPHKHVLRAILKRYGAKKVVYIPSNLDGVVTKSSSVDFIRCEDGGPAEFLSLIKYAEAVCTDSFHGMALSINYEKQFCTIGRVQEGSGFIASEDRQNNVLKKCGLGARKVACVKDVQALADVDYEQVKVILGKEILRSEEFLREAVGEER